MSKQSDRARSRGRPAEAAAAAAAPVEAVSASAAPQQSQVGGDTAKQQKRPKSQPKQQKQLPAGQQQKQQQQQLPSQCIFSSLPLLPVEDCSIVQPPASRRCFNRSQGVEEEEEASDSDATEEAEVIESGVQGQEPLPTDSSAVTAPGPQLPEEAILTKSTAVPPAAAAEAEPKAQAAAAAAPKPKAKARGKANAKATPKAKAKDVKSGILLEAEGKNGGSSPMLTTSQTHMRRQPAIEETSPSNVLGNSKAEFRRSSSLDALVGTRDDTDDMRFNGEVKLHVYHLTKQVASIGLPIYHTAIEVYDQEIFFCLDGIVRCSPGGYSQGVEKVVLTLGKTKLNSVRVEQAVKKLKRSWPGKDYKLLSHNCQTFAFEFTQLLLPGASFPSEYCRFAGPVSKPSGKPNNSLFAGIGA
eukprot:TRINITY_DN11522_c0_g1_i1.p1 TRINITY_DN11522_c0_g1~~TRINITY_DN11522_c0_g1_i1.p1  ORF type:complete len:413 (+),score=131.83 TRINITY_DN11522_c0_g1_i1:54-1292(+)